MNRNLICLIIVVIFSMSCRKKVMEAPLYDNFKPGMYHYDIEFEINIYKEAITLMVSESEENDVIQVNMEETMNTSIAGLKSMSNYFHFVRKYKRFAGGLYGYTSTYCSSGGMGFNLFDPGILHFVYFPNFEYYHEENIKEYHCGEIVRNIVVSLNKTTIEINDQKYNTRLFSTYLINNNANGNYINYYVDDQYGVVLYEWYYKNNSVDKVVFRLNRYESL